MKRNPDTQIQATAKRPKVKGTLKSFTKSEELSPRAKAILLELSKGIEAKPATNHEATVIHGYDIRSLPDSKEERRSTKKTERFYSSGPVPAPAPLKRKHTLANTSMMGKETPDKQSLDTRLQSLRDSIDKNLFEIGHYIKVGKRDQALKICSLVADKQRDFIELVQAYALRNSVKPEPETQREPRPSQIKVRVKQKRYSRWSEK